MSNSSDLISECSKAWSQIEALSSVEEVIDEIEAETETITPQDLNLRERVEFAVFSAEIK